MIPISLKHCLDTTDAVDLKRRLGAMLGGLPTGTLPLRHGCDQGGLVDDHDISASVLGVEQNAGSRDRQGGGLFYRDRGRLQLP